MSTTSSPQIGPFIKCPYPEIIETCAHAGFDLAVVDMEHTPLGPRDLYPLVLASELHKLDLIVRIPMKLEMYFKWCLDLNIKYIQVPFIQTKEDAEECIKQSFFYPEGERGLCRFVRAANFSAKEKNNYISQAKNQTQLILQIEGQKGLANIETIINVKGIYAIFVGPYDLSQSYGKPGDIWAPEVVNALRKIKTLCHKNGVKIGTFTDSPEGISKWKNEGIDFIQYASDLNLFLDSAKKIKEAVL